MNNNNNKNTIDEGENTLKADYFPDVTLIGENKKSKCQRALTKKPSEIFVSSSQETEKKEEIENKNPQPSKAFKIIVGAVVLIVITVMVVVALFFIGVL